MEEADKIIFEEYKKKFEGVRIKNDLESLSEFYCDVVTFFEELKKKYTDKNILELLDIKIEDSILRSMTFSYYAQQQEEE